MSSHLSIIYCVPGIFLGNTPLWFLLSLFLAQVLSFYIVRIKYYFIFILLLLPLGLYLQINSIILPLGASNLPLELFFILQVMFIQNTLPNMIWNIIKHYKINTTGYEYAFILFITAFLVSLLIIKTLDKLKNNFSIIKYF